MPLWSRNRVWYPIDIREPESEELFSEDPRTGQRRAINQRVLDCAQGQTRRARSFLIRSVALAYYQWRELVLLVEDGLGLPTTASAGTTYDIQVKYNDRRSGETAYQWLKARPAARAPSSLGLWRSRITNGVSLYFSLRMV